MEKLWQWIPLFLTGFLISRIFATTGLAERVLHYFLWKSRGRFPLLLLAIIGSATVLSFFIPNMLTVLTLLTVIASLRTKIQEIEPERSTQLMTALGLALIYGANIGGMGSMVGSPANALMLAWLNILKVPGREHIDFLLWLLWGIPLAVIFALIAWALLVIFLVPRRFYRLQLDLEPPSQSLSHHCRDGRRLSLWTALFWIVISSLSSLFPHLRIYWNGLSVLFGVWFVAYVFLRKLKRRDGSLRPLLTLEDCYTGLPWRGVFIAVAAGLLGTVLMWLQLPQWIAEHFQALLPETMSIFTFYAVFSLLTIFATELISNTAVSVTLFPIAFNLAQKLHYHPLPVMIAVALASTCAFMSPLATPATGLAFGGMEDISLKRMLSLGILVNFLGGLWIAWFLTTVIPRFYGFSLVVP